jgi:hypothetical protein
MASACSTSSEVIPAPGLSWRSHLHTSPLPPATHDKTTARDAKSPANRSTIFALVSPQGLFAMPIRQYFVWVGSVLLLALFAADWWLPRPAVNTHSAVPPNERVNLRIRSDHKWPERVVFDTAHSGLQLTAGSESKPDVVPDQDRAETEPRSRRDAFAAMEAAPATPTATNDKASAIRAKPGLFGARMSNVAKAY